MTFCRARMIITDLPTVMTVWVNIRLLTMFLYRILCVALYRMDVLLIWQLTSVIIGLHRLY
jgi:hypothetical protein